MSDMNSDQTDQCTLLVKVKNILSFCCTGQCAVLMISH